MKILALLLLAAPLMADCRPGEVLRQIRPIAEFAMTDDVVTVWRSTDTIPSKGEMAAATLLCQTEQATRFSQKRQARLDIKNALLTIQQRFDALLILQDLDQ